MLKPHLHIDFETFSMADINSVGAYRYANDPSTEILCAGMALGDEEPVCYAPYGERLEWDIPDKYWDALEDPKVLVYAFNAGFEIAISFALMEKTWGIKPPAIERWRCARSMALRAALPGSLEKLGEVLELTTKKDNRGKALIKKFSMMQPAKKPTLKNPKGVPVRRIYPQDDPTAFAEFLEYCKTDVIVERQAVDLLSYFDEPINNVNFTLHAVINHRGVAVNLDALRHAQSLIEQETEMVGREFYKLSGFQFTQGAVFLEWLHSQGCHLDNLQAETIETFLEQFGEPMDDDPDALLALRMKQSVAYAAIKKVQTMVECAGPHDNRIRGMLNHHGATTGRSTNSLVQFQNMKRPAGHMAAEASKGKSWSEVAYKAICDGISREEVEICFGPVLEVISSCIRHFVHDV